LFFFSRIGSFRHSSIFSVFLDSKKNPTMSEETAPQQVEKEVAKVEAAAIKIQNVYRLQNGEWTDFENGEVVDKADFYKIFHREMLSNGEQVCEIEYDKDGNELQKTANTYDENGNVILHELFTEGVLVEKTEIVYDEKQNVIKETREFDEGFPLTTFFKYDEEGRVIEKRVDDVDGELQKKETFAYHPIWKDKIVKHVLLDEEDQITIEEDNEWEERSGEVKAKRFVVRDISMGKYRRTEFFDPRTREDKIAIATFNEKEKVQEYVKIIFDEKDRELEEHSVSVNDSDNFIVYYTYDALDRVIVQEQHQGDKVVSKINRRFGNEGLVELIGIRSFTRGSYVDAFEYEFHEK
jgi:hypothetical protein